MDVPVEMDGYNDHEHDEEDKIGGGITQMIIFTKAKLYRSS